MLHIDAFGNIFMAVIILMKTLILIMMALHLLDILAVLCPTSLQS